MNIQVKQKNFVKWYYDGHFVVLFDEKPCHIVFVLLKPFQHLYHFQVEKGQIKKVVRPKITKNVVRAKMGTLELSKKNSSHNRNLEI